MIYAWQSDLSYNLNNPLMIGKPPASHSLLPPSPRSCRGEEGFKKQKIRKSNLGSSCHPSPLGGRVRSMRRHWRTILFELKGRATLSYRATLLVFLPLYILLKKANIYLYVASPYRATEYIKVDTA